MSDIKTGAIYVTPSGRRWRLAEPHRTDFPGRRYLSPLGDDVFGFGGVKGMYVAVERLDGSDKTWKPVEGGTA